MEIQVEESGGTPTGGRTFEVKAQSNLSVNAVVHATGSFLAAPDIMVALQSLIIPGAKVDEGMMIQAVNIPWIWIANEFKKDPLFLHKIDPRKFEELIAAAYHRDGYEVTLTDRSGDGGVDVIAVKKGFLTVRVLDQAKKYKPGHLVTAAEVSALVGSLVTDNRATHGVVTTTSDFAPKIADYPSIKALLPNRLKLVNGIELRTRLEGLV
jgi:restriction system protein